MLHFISISIIWETNTKPVIATSIIGTRIKIVFGKYFIIMLCPIREVLHVRLVYRKNKKLQNSTQH